MNFSFIRKKILFKGKNMNQNEKTKWIIAISDTCNDEINVSFSTIE